MGTDFTQKESIMFGKLTKTATILAAIVFALAALTAGCTPKNAIHTLDDGTMSIRGKAREIDRAAGTFVVKHPGGTKVKITLTPETRFKGLGSAREIKKFLPLQVIYRIEGDRNLAIRVEAIPEGSC